ncbi:DUF397 domain-containing protein [Thermopolyspora sp. NPDC052614]|uniref:DUF397 domain-containing protein n=1 Tax=Thermopolyspora sp. NPDC052614 TaxID=3155682 RepID=UPI00342EA235
MRSSSHPVDLTRAQWRKSTYSNGNGGACVEVARNIPGIVAVRDSKNPSGPALVLSPGAWTAFLARVRAGDVTP